MQEIYTGGLIESAIPAPLEGKKKAPLDLASGTEAV